MIPGSAAEAAVDAESGGSSPQAETPPSRTSDSDRASRSQGDAAGAQELPSPKWTFLTNHAHVLVALARDPGKRLRDVALLVGITERSVQSIVADLEAADYLRRVRVGRRNRYEVNAAGPFRHPAERDHAVGELLGLFTDDDAGGAAPAGTDGAGPGRGGGVDHR
jgi:hypothetical protein